MAVISNKDSHAFFKGDTIPRVCERTEYAPKIDLRITLPSITCVDLSVMEYAKKYDDSKYYKDKVKIVLCSFIYFHDLLKKTNNREMKIPSMIISRLEGEMLILHSTNEGWFALEKIINVDTPPPPSVELVKKEAIKNYVNTLKYFKVQ
ncbi:hypothetical protein BD408DRAFT_381446 [Parasitella parasitica]|nr:hypothetical protein BD408DRAFT_381446 [Parasitella parasitica]